VTASGFSGGSFVISVFAECSLSGISNLFAIIFLSRNFSLTDIYSYLIKFEYASGLFLSFLFLFPEIVSPQTDKSVHKPVAEILFISNLNGNIEYCNCPSKNTGGLNHLATIVYNYRKKNPAVIFIDGGDFFNPYPFAELNSSVAEIYNQLHPDILVPGDQEFLNADYSEPFKNLDELTLLASNWSMGSQKWPAVISRQSAAGDRISFLSYLHPDAFEFIEKPAGLKFDQQFFLSEYKSLHNGNKNINIAVFHGPEERLTEFTGQFKKFDIILLAHNQSYRSDLNSHPVIIGGGSDGDSIIHIQVYRNDRRISVKTNKIAVTIDIPEVQEITDIIEQFKLNIQKKRGK